MAAPKGTRPPNAGKGRPKGVPNKATAKLKALAQRYGPEAIAVLLTILRKGETETARISAARELLDRGYGKSPQALTGADGGTLPLTTTVVHEYRE